MRTIIAPVNFSPNSNNAARYAADVALKPFVLLVFPKKHSFFEFHRSHAKKLALNGTVPIMSIHA